MEQATTCCGVTESLFWGWGPKRGQTFIWGGGGGLEDSIAMIFCPITFIVHNQKSNGGGGPMGECMV